MEYRDYNLSFHALHAGAVLANAENHRTTLHSTPSSQLKKKKKHNLSKTESDKNRFLHSLSCLNGPLAHCANLI